MSALLTISTPPSLASIKFAWKRRGKYLQPGRKRIPKGYFFSCAFQENSWKDLKV